MMDTGNGAVVGLRSVKHPKNTVSVNQLDSAFSLLGQKTLRPWTLIVHDEQSQQPVGVACTLSNENLNWGPQQAP